ncbi:MAG: hypothetical protein ACXAEX_02080 [Promethearchaeota archaeon]|jgi:hypothetical protein
MKRFAFGFNILLIVLVAVATMVGTLSAWGASCVAWDEAYAHRSMFVPFPPPGRTILLFRYVADAYPTFQIMNILTWFAGGFGGVVIYALLTKRSWAYWGALICSAIGFISGVIPAVIADTALGSVSGAPDPLPNTLFGAPFDFGSPHWGRTMVWLLVFIVVVAIILLDTFSTTTIRSFITEETRFAGNTVRQLVLIGGILLSYSLVSIFGQHFMREAHLVAGVNTWEFVQAQFIGGISIGIASVTTFSSAVVLAQLQKRSNLIKTI